MAQALEKSATVEDYAKGLDSTPAKTSRFWGLKNMLTLRAAHLR
jgi:hypothetical protein